MEHLLLVWDFFQFLFENIPRDIVSVGSFIFCGVGVVGILRSF